MKTKVLCIRLKADTIAILEKMAKFDGMDMEERLSQVVEQMVEMSQEG